MNAKIQCNKCGRCCQGEIGPFIFPSDVNSICKNIQVKPALFIKTYCDCHVIMASTQSIEIYSLKMVSGHCIFLNEKNLCDIYQFRPFQCVNAPFDFLANYNYWSHMPCIQEEDFLFADSSKNDKMMLHQLLDIGYHDFTKRGE